MKGFIMLYYDYVIIVFLSIMHKIERKTLVIFIYIFVIFLEVEVYLRGKTS